MPIFSIPYTAPRLLLMAAAVAFPDIPGGSNIELADKGADFGVQNRILATTDEEQSR